MRGGLSTIDRDYGVFNKIHHDIGTHVVHHLFPQIPHYNLDAATEGAKVSDRMICHCRQAVQACTLFLFLGNPAGSKRGTGLIDAVVMCVPCGWWLSWLRVAC